MKKLPLKFYDRDDVAIIARELLGCIIVTNIDGHKTTGRIVETEAYLAITDKASHSFGGRRTQKMNICIAWRVPLIFISVMACTRC